MLHYLTSKCLGDDPVHPELAKLMAATAFVPTQTSLAAPSALCDPRCKELAAVMDPCSQFPAGPLWQHPKVSFVQSLFLHVVCIDEIPSGCRAAHTPPLHIYKVYACELHRLLEVKACYMIPAGPGCPGEGWPSHKGHKIGPAGRCTVL